MANSQGQMPQGHDDTDWMLMLKQSPQKALGLLYDKYSAVLMGLIRKIVGDADLAGQVLQQVFLKIYAQLPALDIQNTNLLAWMLSIARRSALEAAGLVTVNDPANIQAGNNLVYKRTDLPASGKSQNKKDNNEIVSLHDERGKTVLELIYFQNASYQEVADKLEIDVETVKKTFLSALKDLKEISKT